MNRTSVARVSRAGAGERSRGASGGERAATLAPPRYGIDFVDRGLDTSAAVQLKRKGKVTDKYIQEVLAEVGNEALRNQLAYAWQLIQSHGEAYFDDEITKSFGGYDPGQGKLIFSIPKQSFFQWHDTTIEKKGIVIHELTHVAEVAANTGGMKNLNYDMKTTRIMQTDLEKIDDLLDGLLEQLSEDRKVFEAVDYLSSSTSDTTLYGYLRERLLYAGNKVLMEGSNFELPTVVNQFIYVVEAKGAEAVKKTETWRRLLKLQAELIESRARRFEKNG